MIKYDYIIVGGGSAGSSLVARLNKSSEISVCLLEAGGDGKGIVAPVAAVFCAP